MDNLNVNRVLKIIEILAVSREIERGSFSQKDMQGLRFYI